MLKDILEVCGRRNCKYLDAIIEKHSRGSIDIKYRISQGLKAIKKLNGKRWREEVTKAWVEYLQRSSKK